MVNPVFADDPLSALALAEALGELPRPLNWAAPSLGTVLRLARGLLEEARPVRKPVVPPRWNDNTLSFPLVRAGRARALLTVRRDPPWEAFTLIISFRIPTRHPDMLLHGGDEEGVVYAVRLSIDAASHPRPGMSVANLVLGVAARGDTACAEAIAELCAIAHRALDADGRPPTADRRPLNAKEVRP